jgi:penicillin-insensitive murein endopeptidase
MLVMLKPLVKALLFSVISAGSVQANPWAAVTTSADLGNGAQSIGTYNSGCLAGAEALPADGTGYQVMRLSRQRLYGHPALTWFIKNLGQSVAAQGFGTLLIGDLGQVRGGPTLSGHRSHQTGLDVDIWFLQSAAAQQRRLSPQERETLSASTVLAADGESLNPQHWSTVQAQILLLAVNMPEVDRIFVNPSIKRELCQQVSNRAALRKIRPWFKHDDHFHVRLKCPNNNQHCTAQEPLPAGDGCGTELAWWFSEEAKHPTPSKTASTPPPLPVLCQTVLIR